MAALDNILGLIQHLSGAQQGPGAPPQQQSVSPVDHLLTLFGVHPQQQQQSQAPQLPINSLNADPATLSAGLAAGQLPQLPQQQQPHNGGALGKILSIFGA